jgi:hypothetical protein
MKQKKHLRLVKPEEGATASGFEYEVQVSACDDCDGAIVRVLVDMPEQFRDSILVRILDMKDEATGKLVLTNQHLKFSLWHKLTGRERAVRKFVKKIRRAVERTFANTVKNNNTDWLAKV